jgi:hypothetical protein
LYDCKQELISYHQWRSALGTGFWLGSEEMARALNNKYHSGKPFYRPIGKFYREIQTTSNRSGNSKIVNDDDFSFGIPKLK